MLLLTQHNNYYHSQIVGEMIRQLTHEKIKQSIDNNNWIHDIAVREGKMVLACREAGVMLFNIH